MDSHTTLMIFAVVAALSLMTGLLIVESSTAKALPEQSDNRLRACSNYEAHQSGAASLHSVSSKY